MCLYLLWKDNKYWPSIRRYNEPCAVCFAFPCMYLYIRNHFWICTICNIFLCAWRYIFRLLISKNDVGDESALLKWHPKRSLIHFWWHHQYIRNLSEASSLHYVEVSILFVYVVVMKKTIRLYNSGYNSSILDTIQVLIDVLLKN